MNLIIAFKEIPEGFFENYLGLFDDIDRKQKVVGDAKYIELEFSPSNGKLKEINPKKAWVIENKKIKTLWVDCLDEQYVIYFEDRMGKPYGKPSILVGFSEVFYSRDKAEKKLLKMLYSRIDQLSREFDEITRIVDDMAFREKNENT